ncbi:MAG: hypothetical protein ACLU48_04520 [Clostridiaceae bacterium]
MLKGSATRSEERRRRWLKKEYRPWKRTITFTAGEHRLRGEPDLTPIFDAFFMMESCTGKAEGE